MTTIDQHIRAHPELTEQQEATLRAFRQELLDEGIITEKGDTLGTQHDWVLLRFLRARRYNLKNAKIMIKECIEWRRTVQGVGIDELYRRLDPFDYPERPEVFKHWPIWYHKTDKKGRPLNVQALGSIDVPALHNIMTPDKFWETIVVTSEGAMREVLGGCSYAAGRIVDDILVIVDLKGFGLSKFWQMMDLIRDSFHISQDYLPETLGMLVVINAPYTFTAIWSVVKHMLAEETQDKVRIFGSDYVPFLLEHVDADNLPKSLGGKCTCSDAGGCHLSNAGPWVEGRKERREKWLRGEIPRPGLGLEDLAKEGEDKKDEKEVKVEVEVKEEKEDLEKGTVKSTASQRLGSPLAPDHLHLSAPGANEI